MNTIVFSTLVSSIATVVIAIYAYRSYQLSSNIQKQSQEYQQQVSDLYQAIVISNTFSDPNANLDSTHLEHKIKAFKELYKGKTPIFD